LKFLVCNSKKTAAAISASRQIFGIGKRDAGLCTINKTDATISASRQTFGTS
jgi:hypothetical protein